MSILKSTLKIESTDLFPTPVSYTVVNFNSVEGNFSGFQNLDLTTVGQKLNIAPINGTSLSAYCYFKNDSASASTAYVYRLGEESFLSLAPGDVSLLSYGGITATADLYAKTNSGTAKLSFFIGEK